DRTAPRSHARQNRRDFETGCGARQRQSHNHRGHGLYRPPGRPGGAGIGHGAPYLGDAMKLPRASAVVSTVFGIGYFPQAQGTIMSAIALPLGILIAMYGGGAMGLVGASLIVLVIGILACAEHARETGNPDPSECVIDELAGQWLASAFVAFGTVSLPAFILSFLLFRLFDIWKPWPVYL